MSSDDFRWEVLQMMTFEILEWRDRRYQHFKYVNCTPQQARSMVGRLNEGYTGPRFIYREV